MFVQNSPCQSPGPIVLTVIQEVTHNQRFDMGASFQQIDPLGAYQCSIRIARLDTRRCQRFYCLITNITPRPRDRLRLEIKRAREQAHRCTPHIHAVTRFAELTQNGRFRHPIRQLFDNSGHPAQASFTTGCIHRCEERSRY